MSSSPHILVLPDQLTDQVGPVYSALSSKKTRPTILMVESRDSQPAPRHVQALVTLRAAGREFAEQLRAQGLTVQLIQAETYEEGLSAACAAGRVTGLHVMEPSGPQDRKSVV